MSALIVKHNVVFEQLLLGLVAIMYSKYCLHTGLAVVSPNSKTDVFSPHTRCHNNLKGKLAAMKRFMCMPSR